ncbi:prepilin-type N-terminal cleavage/methylation domain-containing protein [Methylobacterium sp. WL19]|uniref:type IV pilus modification PilV family protein n=1 Tax=Methylobacterium sp. WL19 TaxID=2603896 RepID=UPI001AEE7B9B|nr:prepilin-type N-terminal cleavage/methylation domain-containing protein [Methylobacterium sp. WL19]
MSSDRPRPKPVRRAGARAGFTLIEVLVALTVLAAVSPALFRMAVLLRSGTEVIDDRTRSEIVARSLLEAALGQREAAQYSLSGRTDGRGWSVEARPLEGATGRIAAGTGRGPGTAPKPGRDAAPKAAASGEGDRQADRKADEEEVLWMPVGVTIRVETAGSPLRIDTIALARKAPS